MSSNPSVKSAPARKAGNSPAARPPGAAPRPKPAKTAAKTPAQRTTAPSKPAAAATAPAAKPQKQKHKLVRDSFAMPGPDFALIQILKDRALAFQRPAKKSELLRAGLHALVALPDARLRAALDSLAPLKAGRPKKAA